MATGSITTWQIEGEKAEVVTDFLFLGSKITVDSYCNHEIRRQLLLGRKVMTNLRCWKQRHFSAFTGPSIIKAMVFPVVRYGCESWTIKKAEYQRINAFELWCCRRLLRVPWKARRSSQSILREINPEYSLEGLMLKLKLHILVIWCEQMTHCKSTWCWERSRAEGEEAIRGWDGWTAPLVQWTSVWGNSRRW